MASSVVATDLLALVPAWADRSGLLTPVLGGGMPNGDYGVCGATHVTRISAADRVEQPVAKAGFRPRMVDVPGPPPRGAPV